MLWAPAVLVMLVPCTSAWAVPATVELRVEGGSSTIFEGPVTTDAKTIVKGTNTLVCDGSGDSGNPGPGPTPISALDDAQVPGGWDNAFGADFVHRIGPEAATATQFWGIAVNRRPLAVGGCQVHVSPADEVLFAFDFFEPDPPFAERPMLGLVGPARAAAGRPVGLSVTESAPPEFQARPAAGAAVAGTATGPDGAATVTFGEPGLVRLKAERDGSIRSNALLVCVSDTGAGDCGVPPATLGSPAAPGAVTDSAAPAARINGPRNGRRYRRGPRLLRGTARDDGSGVTEVKLAIRRHTRGGCRWWSGRRERFVGRDCRKTFFFAIGKDANWSYLMPRALGPGRYVVDVKAFDARRNRNRSFVRGMNRAVFEVRPRRAVRSATAAAAAARVEVLVAGRERVVAGPFTVRARAASVRASGRRCAVRASTPLAALVAALGRRSVGYRLKDFGSCSPRRTRDSGQLFVNRVGRDRNRGQDGWVYKVDDRALSRGAAEGRVRPGDRVAWLYCHQQADAGGCQRSLRVVPAKRRGLAGESLHVRVLAYDDRGRGRAAAGARVTLRAGRTEITAARAGADGAALLTFPGPGSYALDARAEGLVPSFPVRIRAR
jgi:hypothetical protein